MPPNQTAQFRLVASGILLAAVSGATGYALSQIREHRAGQELSRTCCALLRPRTVDPQKCRRRRRRPGPAGRRGNPETRTGPPDTCQHYSEGSRQHLKMTTAGGDARSGRRRDAVPMNKTDHSPSVAESVGDGSGGQRHGTAGTPGAGANLGGPCLGALAGRGGPGGGRRPTRPRQPSHMPRARPVDPPVRFFTGTCQSGHATPLVSQLCGGADRCRGRTGANGDHAMPRLQPGQQRRHRPTVDGLPCKPQPSRRHDPAPPRRVTHRVHTSDTASQPQRFMPQR